ncbi:hypothetical protein NDR87_34445 [Nocardia sp. CDC159]|uniref:Transmembrane protein n=1 Tax=Nocardia pulmonis TaxID=2951408 RepID=A0A9X2EH36_9NOCA|nr:MULTISPECIES: hypothetical protein [Nocardia]MCM6778593.1 hypothetical protein [Nocardia pulmonis]MCM6791482.1 hypothetical protein [Nocardia sp. CDC159]
MNWNKRIRQTHRWLAVLFTATVVVTVVVLAVGGPVWMSYLPLPPLALLLFSGLYLFAQPYRTKRRPTRPHTFAGWARQAHRWSAVVFTATVLATFVALSLPNPIVWVSYLPLIPLAALLFSGLYMLTLTYRTRRRASAPLPSGSGV